MIIGVGLKQIRKWISSTTLTWTALTLASSCEVLYYTSIVSEP